MIELTVFFTGAAVMALEVLGTRVLSPSFGSGLYVWAALISVALVALSIGYFAGGWLADRRPTHRAMFTVLLVGAATVGLSVLVAGGVLGAAEQLGLRAGSLVGAAALFGVPLALLGTITPYSVRLRTAQLGNVGHVAGRLYALGTIGSVVGTLGTAFWVIPSIGHRTAMLGIAVALALWAAIGLLGATRRGAAVAAGVALALVGLAFAGGAPPALPGVVYDDDGPLGRITVLDRRYDDGYEERLFLLDGACQTHMPEEPTGEVACEYVRTFDLMRQWRPDASRAFLIGLAGGAHVRLLGRHGFDFDVADIDPRAMHVATEYFNLPHGDRVRLHLEDGRRCLRRLAAAGARYDVVIIDMLTIDAVPVHLYSREALEEARDAMTPDGIVGVNTSLVFDVDGERASASIHRTLREVFPHVRCYAAHSDARSQTENRIFFASRAPLGPAVGEGLPDRERTFADDTGIVLTDDHNPFDVLLATTSDRFRLSFRRQFPGIAHAGW